MNASRCTSCGDTHLCPGTNRPIPAGDSTLIEQVRRYVADTFTFDPTGVIGTADAWTAYLHWCTATGSVAYSQRRFIGAMALQPGVRRVKRSTMRFTGIGWKRSQIRGRHSAPEPVMA